MPVLENSYKGGITPSGCIELNNLSSSKLWRILQKQQHNAHKNSIEDNIKSILSQRCEFQPWHEPH